MGAIKLVLLVVTGIGVALLLIEGIWSVLNIQSCQYDLPKNATCEQIAQNDSKNCKYIILKWKTVDYNSELKKCEDWEQNQKD